MCPGPHSCIIHMPQALYMPSGPCACILALVHVSWPLCTCPGPCACILAFIHMSWLLSMCPSLHPCMLPPPCIPASRALPKCPHNKHTYACKQLQTHMMGTNSCMM